MSDDYSLTLTLRGHGIFPPIIYCMPLSNGELCVSARAVQEMQIGLADFAETVQMMRVKQMRKELFIKACAQIGALLAERMEDAEGWHDYSRVEPARKQIGYNP